MKKLVRVLVAALIGVLALSVEPAAAEEWIDGAWHFVANVPGHEPIVVQLEDQPRRSLLASDGTKVLHLEPGNAVRVAEAFEREGIGDDVLARFLLGMPAGDNLAAPARGPAGIRPCLTIEVAGDRIRLGGEPGRLSMPLSAAPRLIDPATGDRFVRWSAEEGLAIKRALEERGFGLDAVMRVWSSTRDATPAPGTEALQMLIDREIRPECNDCINGIWIATTNACHYSGTRMNCTVCTFCP